MKLAYFQGSVCFSIFWDAANAQQAKGGRHIYPFVFFEMSVPAKPPPPKYQNAKLPEPKCRCRDHHCPPGDPHCFHLHLPRSWILLLVQLYPAKHRRFYQGLNFNQSIKLEKDIWENPNYNLSRSITCYWSGFLGVWSRVVKTKRGYLCTQRWKYKISHFLRQASPNIQRLWTRAEVQSTLNTTFARGKVLGWQTNNTNISYQILIFCISLLHITCIILFIALRWHEVILGLWSPQNSFDFYCC